MPGLSRTSVDKRHREVARDNLRHAFPDACADPVECDRLVRACYTPFLHDGRRARRASAAADARAQLAVVGTPNHFERIVVPVIGDRPVLLVTAHFGNWEVAGYVTGVVGFTSYAIARDLDNPYLDRFLQKFRQKTGQTILSKTGDFDRITAGLKAGGIVATLGDQDAGPKGLFVDFFSRPASTHKAVALLAMEHDAADGRHRRAAGRDADEVRPGHRGGDRPARLRRPTTDAVRAITERFTRRIERLVRRHPEQYFWLHRRWKHQPPVRKPLVIDYPTPSPEHPPCPASHSSYWSSCVSIVPAEDKPKAADWKTLFDGKSLDGWKKSYDRGSGKVEVKDGAIVLGTGEKMTGITYTKSDFPKTDYEVVLEGKRVDGRDFFATTTFPVGDVVLLTGGRRLGRHGDRHLQHQRGRRLGERDDRVEGVQDRRVVQDPHPRHQAKRSKPGSATRRRWTSN